MPIVYRPDFTAAIALILFMFALSRDGSMKLTVRQWVVFPLQK